jgi:membrane-bound serine protease (ClpP class)
MEPLPLALLLLAVGLVLLALEALLPAYGVIGLMGVASILGAVGACFFVDQRLGVAALAGFAVLTPLLWAAWVRLWPRTAMGRRMILQTVAGQAKPESQQVFPGQAGVAVTELRPGGECRFGDHRVEAYSEQGIISAGQPVRAVSVSGNRVLVRPA